MFSSKVKDKSDIVVRVHFSSNTNDRAGGTQAAPQFDVTRFCDVAASSFDLTRPVYVTLEGFRNIGTSTPFPFAVVWNDMPISPNNIAIANSAGNIWMNQMLGYFNATPTSMMPLQLSSNALAIPVQLGIVLQNRRWSFRFVAWTGTALTDAQIGPYFFTLAFFQKGTDSHDKYAH